MNSLKNGAWYLKITLSDQWESAHVGVIELEGLADDLFRSRSFLLQDFCDGVTGVAYIMAVTFGGGGTSIEFLAEDIDIRTETDEQGTVVFGQERLGNTPRIIRFFG